MDRWFVAITRHVDEQNHYYMTARSPNRIELERLVNGAFTTLASAPLAMQLNRDYRLRLESWARITACASTTASCCRQAMQRTRPGPWAS